MAMISKFRAYYTALILDLPNLSSKSNKDKRKSLPMCTMVSNQQVSTFEILLRIIYKSMSLVERCLKLLEL